MFFHNTFSALKNAGTLLSFFRQVEKFQEDSLIINSVCKSELSLSAAFHLTHICNNSFPDQTAFFRQEAENAKATSYYSKVSFKFLVRILDL